MWCYIITYMGKYVPDSISIFVVAAVAVVNGACARRGQETPSLNPLKLVAIAIM